jgi:hypothetical protein
MDHLTINKDFALPNNDLVHLADALIERMSVEVKTKVPPTGVYNECLQCKNNKVRLGYLNVRSVVTCDMGTYHVVPNPYFKQNVSI